MSNMEAIKLYNNNVSLVKSNYKPKETTNFLLSSNDLITDMFFSFWESVGIWTIFLFFTLSLISLSIAITKIYDCSTTIQFLGNQIRIFIEKMIIDF